VLIGNDRCESELYDPHIGIFTRPDPAMDGLNHYAYANCNPIRYCDPTGLTSSQGSAASSTGSTASCTGMAAGMGLSGPGASNTTASNASQDGMGIARPPNWWRPNDLNQGRTTEQQKAKTNKPIQSNDPRYGYEQQQDINEQKQKKENNNQKLVKWTAETIESTLSSLFVFVYQNGMDNPTGVVGITSYVKFTNTETKEHFYAWYWFQGDEFYGLAASIGVTPVEAGVVTGYFPENANPFQIAKSYSGYFSVYNLSTPMPFAPWFLGANLNKIKSKSWEGYSGGINLGVGFSITKQNIFYNYINKTKLYQPK